MPTSVSGYQRSGSSQVATGGASSRMPATGAVRAAADPGKTAVVARGQTVAAAVGPQPPVREGWEVPDRPAGVASAGDLRAMQRQQRMATGGRRRRLSPIVVAGILAFCLAAAAGALLYTRSVNRETGTGTSGADASKPSPKPGPTYSFQPFIVNVAGTDGTRYLKAAISVECADKKTSGEIAAVEYKVRDAVIGVLSAYDLEELTNVSKRDAIRRRVAEAIERSLSGDSKEPPRVRGVYFLEFVIQ